jgi:hypothetical protein
VIGHRAGWLVVVVPAALAALAAPAAAARPIGTAAILKAGVITAHDVPSTWISTPRTLAPDPFPSGAACRTLASAERAARRSPHAVSPQFSDPASGNTTEADNTVYAFASAVGAHRYLAAYEASTASACLQLVLTEAVGASATATVAPLTTQLAGLGDESAGYEGTVQGTNGAGQTVALVADIVAVRVGRAVTVFEFLSANQQIAAGPTIVNTVVKRLPGR